MSIAEQAWSQLKQAKADYFSGPIQYSPDDPWVRSKIFQAHTGHAGHFYNCDDEECKRYSPYIKWTTNCEPQWPQHLGIIRCIRMDIDKIRQRINRGSCGCDDCCETCQNEVCTCQNSIADRSKRSEAVRVAFKDE
jgi:hypothetical protein